MKPNVRARATSFTYECSAKSITTLRFSEPNIGCGKSIVKSSLKPLNGSNRAHLSPSRHLDREQDAQITLRRLLLDDARRLQQEHEGTRAAVHDRDLRTGDVDVAGCRCRARRAPTSGARRWKSTRRRCFSVGRQARVADVHARRRGWTPAARRSTRWNTIPVSGGRRAEARSRRAAPVWRPTPVVLIVVLSVRCFSMSNWQTAVADAVVYDDHSPKVQWFRRILCTRVPPWFAASAIP